MIRVLVVEDSLVVRDFLVHLLSSDPGIQVIGTASNGEEALQVMEQIQPDLITMDIHMPGLDGLEATRRIMETHPTPIVIVSGSSSSSEVATTFRAIEAGAVAFVERPRGLGHAEHERGAQELIRTVKLMAEIKVVRRWAHLRRLPLPVAASPALEACEYPLPRDVKVVAIGASTGGPLVLQTILSRLPRDCPVPILVVQHMAAGFLEGFIGWLAATSTVAIHIPTDGQRMQPGQCYIAPDGLQMKVDFGGILSLNKDELENGHRPSAGYLFRSVARVYGPRAVGILLTGMGKDGAEGLKAMRDRGALTIAQDKQSSVVHGMPGEAIRLEGASHVLSPDRIAAALASVLNRRETPEKD